MYDDIINILNLNHSDVQSCTSKKENNRITYYITLIRKEFFCPLCFHKLYIKDYRSVKLNHQIIRCFDTRIIYRKRRYYCSRWYYVKISDYINMRNLINCYWLDSCIHIHLVIWNHNVNVPLSYYRILLCIQILIYMHVHNLLS